MTLPSPVLEHCATLRIRPHNRVLLMVNITSSRLCPLLNYWSDLQLCIVLPKFIQYTISLLHNLGKCIVMCVMRLTHVSWFPPPHTQTHYPLNDPLPRSITAEDSLLITIRLNTWIFISCYMTSAAAIPRGPGGKNVVSRENWSEWHLCFAVSTSDYVRVFTTFRRLPWSMSQYTTHGWGWRSGPAATHTMYSPGLRISWSEYMHD